MTETKSHHCSVLDSFRFRLVTPTRTCKTSPQLATVILCTSAFMGTAAARHGCDMETSGRGHDSWRYCFLAHMAELSRSWAAACMYTTHMLSISARPNCMSYKRECVYVCECVLRKSTFAFERCACCRAIHCAPCFFTIMVRIGSFITKHFGSTTIGSRGAC